jgi:hypothetical protein
MRKRFLARHFTLAVALPMLAIVASEPANAQAWIGEMVGNMIAQEQAIQREAACMGGTAMPDSEIAETRASAFAAMDGYWNAVRSGAPADVIPFYRDARKASWRAGGTALDGAALHKLTDPLAQTGAVFDATPLAYLRSGDGSSVHGQWAVRRADGGLIGTLDAAFSRSAGQWKLGDLTVYSATEYVEPLVQYCHKVGDVLPYRVASTTQARDYLVKRADRLKAKADKASAALDHAIARTKDEATLRDKRALADAARAKSLAASQAALEAIAANERANADAKAAADKRAAAIAALKG